MKLVLAGFDWDEGNRGKCQKHGVSLDEIEDLFLGEPGVAPDLKHSAQETRFIAAGRTTAGIARGGYVSGISLGDGTYFGRRAGRAAALRAAR